MPLIAASIGLSATARMALPVRVKARKANSAAMTDHSYGQVLHLLRPDAYAVEAPIARDGQIIAPQLVAEAEADDVLERYGQVRWSRWRW